MIKKILPSILGLGLILLGNKANAQLNYTVTFPAGTYSAITAASSTNPVFTLAYPPALAALEGVGAADEGAANSISLPFTFKYNGLSYTKVNISTNGFISLGNQKIDTLNVYWAGNLTSGPYNGTDNNGRGTRPIIAPLWDDLDMQATTNILYNTTGTSPNRIFTVQWTNAKWNWQSTSAVVSFQVKLYEVDNSIRFHYRPGAGNSNRASASVGLTDIFTGSNNFLSLNGLKNTATSSQTVETDTISIKPTTNLQVLFTPTAQPTIDGGLRLLGAPITVTCLNTPQTVVYVIKNAGINIIDSGAATINVTTSGANVGTYTVTNSKALNFNEFDTVSISTIDLNNAGSTLIRGILSVATDTRATNDTSRYTYTTAAVETTFPLDDNGVTPTKVYKYLLAGAGGRSLWTVFNTAALTIPNNDNALAPIPGSNDNGYFAFLGRYSGFNTPGFTSYLYTNCMALPAGLPASNYNLSFFMTQDSAQSNSTTFSGEDSLYVVVSTDKGVTFNRIAGFARQDLTATDFNWVNQNVALDAFAGQTIQLGFEGVSQMGNIIGLDSITVTANYPLPITLSVFSGVREGNKNILNWQTANEVNNKGFELERSIDGKEFAKIAVINSKATNGTSNGANEYSYTDEKYFGATNYYRLRQLDKDGKATLSNVVVLKSAQITKAQISRIFPNPVQEKLNVVLNTPTSEKVTVAITDLVGKTITQKFVETTQGDNNIQFNTVQLAKGTYVIKVYSNTNTEIATQKFVK